MNILHIGNTANVAVQLRDAQREMGHEATVLSMWPRSNYLDYPVDLRINPETIGGKVTLALHLFRLIRWADVVHHHNPISPRLVRLVRRQARRKRLIAHHHGMTSVAGWRMMGDVPTLLSTPNLLDHCPVGTYIPNPMPLPPPIEPAESDPVTVIHAHSSPKDIEKVKGTETIRRVMADIPTVRFLEVKGLPHGKALALYREAHLAIDQLRIGWYGMFALECMAMGLPTLGFTRDFGGVPNPVQHVDDDTLRQVVELFADSPEMRRDLGRKQREFVAQNHDPMRIAERVMEVYETGDAP